MSMGEVFIKVLNMSLTAGWLILAVLCVRSLFRKIPKWITCLLWGVVAIRLMFPFSIESEFSLQPSAEPIKASIMVEGEMVPYMPSVDSKFHIVENMVNPVLAETFAYQESDSVAPLQVVAGIAGNVWFCGMILFFMFAAVSVWRLRFSVRESLHYQENIYLCDGVTSPFILGVIQPRIYLFSALSEEEMDYIIAHEKAHLHRYDHLWKPFGYLLLCVYWFNPLCWVAYIMLCKDIELACDEKVIQNMSLGDKKAYSRVLLSCASQRRLVLSCPLSFGEVGVKERVKTVLNYKKPAFWITIIAIMVCMIIAVCFLTNPMDESAEVISNSAGAEDSVNEYQETDLVAVEEPEEYTENPKNSAVGTNKVDTSEVSGIVVINGNTGERKNLTTEDYEQYYDLLQLYNQLDFSVECEENSRVGYQYCMMLQPADEDVDDLIMVIPYKDGVVVDDIFYLYDNTKNGASSSLRLMEYMERIFHPVNSAMTERLTEEPVIH